MNQVGERCCRSLSIREIYVVILTLLLTMNDDSMLKAYFYERFDMSFKHPLEQLPPFVPSITSARAQRRAHSQCHYQSCHLVLST
jgi:hypothetical protein